MKVGKPMDDIAKAVMPVVDRVIELGIADPDRLGVTGLRLSSETEDW